VVHRLIEAAVSITYPADKLQVQVVDDSTDDTTLRAQEWVDIYNKEGVNIQLVHRTDRSGYKAGALQNALPAATGDYIAIFDADFQPAPDFLLQTIPHFLENKQLGMIQARWGHLNDDASALTAVQAIALDKHFAMEQTVRHRANLFPKFNGSGGIWRRACMEDAGGWEDDTVCEDLCLSTRAILKGWDFRFLNDVVAPAELPTSIAAYKNQQARWAKGSSQCLVKFGRPILNDNKYSLTARLYALLSMSAYNTHLLVLTLLLLQIPLLLVDFRFSAKMLLFTVAGIGQPLLFILAQQVLYSDWQHRLRHFPTMVLVAIGIGPSTSRAIVQAFVGNDHPFIRTPKLGEVKRPYAPYSFKFDWIILVELLLTLYAIIGIAIAIWQNNIGPLFFLSTCALGMGYVAYLSLKELRQ
jgi:cellulose synthase/poly-beta-1,6-N-acetylglucosamine synthase-like glycosyltransferase